MTLTTDWPYVTFSARDCLCLFTYVEWHAYKIEKKIMQTDVKMCVVVD